jgi:hypothetical protein
MVEWREGGRTEVRDKMEEAIPGHITKGYGYQRRQMIRSLPLYEEQ